MQRKVTVLIESWPLLKEFKISRGSKIEAEVIKLIIQEDDLIGRSESVPYNRYNESIQTVVKQIEFVQKHIENGRDKEFINSILPAGAARNAVDCALWDLESKKENKDIFHLTKTTPSTQTTTAQTLSIGSPQEMSEEAYELRNFPLIKVKLDEHLVIERMEAIHNSAPESKFIIDPNEGWGFEQLKQYAPRLAELNTVLLEQPIASTEDLVLENYCSPIPLCADESIHTSNELVNVKKRYQYVNIKLDKTGGLTEALNLCEKAKSANLGIMVGCMVGTSLAMAPASILASQADYVDLDGPALLARDRKHGFEYKTGKMSQLNLKLWGGAN